jgi:methylated-DNA-protein-cysteine methyltransferase related protein
MEAPSFYERIFAVVRLIPKGEVMSYSQVARAVGMPRGARLVGWALRTLKPGTDVPWWRVINAKREISIVNPRLGAEEQKNRLEAEGLACQWEEGLYRVMGEDWWQPSEPEVK